MAVFLLRSVNLAKSRLQMCRRVQVLIVYELIER